MGWVQTRIKYSQNVPDKGLVFSIYKEFFQLNKTFKF